MIGQTLGHYRIVEKLGAGGMGEVYRAHDTRLSRDVAIKVLPEALARDPERLARFEREAQVLAALNHPNIAVIYGLEEKDGLRFLVLEYVPGETPRGPMPVEEALSITRQIAEALEHAHEKGIIHRDLKPANIKVTPEGTVKVLDFGLAKAFEAGVSEADLSHSPTLSAAATRQGVILGTAAYMSPEQARGKPVDKRTDIWAFGCVLYELLTAKQVFPGETVSDSMAAILAKEPDWSALPPGSPVSLLRRCLQKDLKLRLRDIGDASFQPEVPAPAIPQKPLLPWALAATLAVLAALALWRASSSNRPARQPVARLMIALKPPPPETGVDGLLGTPVALSPDGTQLAYLARLQSGGENFLPVENSPASWNNFQLYLRSLDQFEASPISGTVGATHPFFSPDGDWIAFFADGKLKKVSLGEPPVTLCDSPGRHGYGGGVWAPDDTIYFARGRGSGIWRVAANGGAPQEATKLDSGKFEVAHEWPDVLPGGQAIIFTARTGGQQRAEGFRVEMQLVRSGQRRTLIEDGHNGRYAPSGHLIYARGGMLMAAPFDIQRLEVAGPSSPVVEGIQMSPFVGGACFTFSQSGSLAYIPNNSASSEYVLVEVNRKGEARPLTKTFRAFEDMNLSPGGRQIVLTITGGEPEVWLYDISRDALNRFVAGSGFSDPIWTPDGKRICYSSGWGREQKALWWKPADGSGPAEQIAARALPPLPDSFSPDGRMLAFTEFHPATGQRIWILPLDGRRQAHPLHQTPFQEWNARFSPDGLWLAYVSDESGRPEIYIEPYPGPGGKVQASTEGGVEPIWARNGRELFYRSGAKLMAVNVAPSLAVGKPTVLFEGPYPFGFRMYDVTPDGQHFILIRGIERSADAPAPPHLYLVLNWFEELKRRVK